MMTYNQLLSTKLLKYFYDVKVEFANYIKDNRSQWTGIFRGAGKVVMKENNVPLKEIPIKKSIYNAEYKTNLFAIEYEEIFTNRLGDAYCICLTFDGDNFHLYTLDKVEINGKMLIYFAEKFIDGRTKLIKEVPVKGVYALCGEVFKVIDKTESQK